MTKEQLRKLMLAGVEQPAPGVTISSVRAALVPVVPGVERSGSGASQESVARPGSQADEISSMTRELAELRQAAQHQSETVESNTRATVETTLIRSAGGFSAAGALSKAAPDVATGLGISPLISGLIGLFRGRSKETEEPLLHHQAPAAVQVEAALTPNGRLAPVTYGAYNLPKPQSYQPVAPQSITIQVQTLDSKSFSDHSAEIARAVKDAMLNSHSLNDVISEV